MIHHVALTESTNVDAAALGRSGAPHGTAVLADAQIGGRGRLGRAWESPAGNLYLSVLLRPSLPLERAPLLCLAAAVAAAEACGAGVRIKWPNDLLAPDGRKVGGILAEIETVDRRIDTVVIGVGLNVSVSPCLPGSVALVELDGRERATEPMAEELVAGILRWSATLDCSPIAVTSRWRELSCTLGQRVRVGEIEGVAIDIDVDGALRVRLDDGSVRRILAGDVEMVRLNS